MGLFEYFQKCLLPSYCDRSATSFTHVPSWYWMHLIWNFFLDWICCVSTRYVLVLWCIFFCDLKSNLFHKNKILLVPALHDWSEGESLESWWRGGFRAIFAWLVPHFCFSVFLGFFSLWINLELIPKVVILEKDIPSTFLDEGTQAKEASSSGAQVSVLFIMPCFYSGISYKSCNCLWYC